MRYIFLLVTCVLISGCNKPRENINFMENHAAYGHKWKYYSISKISYSRPFISDEGLFVERRLEIAYYYLENENGNKILMNDNLYAKLKNNEIKKFNYNLPGVFWTVENYNNKLFLWVSAPLKDSRPNASIFNCAKFIVNKDPPEELDVNKVYNFYGEFVSSRNSFVLDHVSTISQQEEQKLRNGKPTIPFEKYYEQSYKYTCE